MWKLSPFTKKINIYRNKRIQVSPLPSKGIWKKRNREEILLEVEKGQYLKRSPNLAPFLQLMQREKLCKKDEKYPPSTSPHSFIKFQTPWNLSSIPMQDFNQNHESHQSVNLIFRTSINAQHPSTSMYSNTRSKTASLPLWRLLRLMTSHICHHLEKILWVRGRNYPSKTRALLTWGTSNAQGHPRN